MKKVLLSVAAISLMAGGVQAQEARTYEPVTAEEILNPEPGDWLQWRRTVNSHGYSPLDQINRDTVKDLELVWGWALAQGGQQEIAPLVHNGIMFLGENQNSVEALDAVTGDRLWMYMHQRPAFEGAYHENQAQRQKNTLALWDDKVIMTTVDAKLVALNALTGAVEWEVQVNDWEKGYSFTAGPLVANGMIFTFTSGCSIVGTAGACWVTGHDADTGEELWRFNTLDNSDPAVDASWNGVPVENRWGASAWATGSYDPELNMVYFGTGMPVPYSEVTRGTGDGNVLYTNSTIALDATTGELKWFYQHHPRDNWDLDSPFERLIIETEVNGEMRKLIVTTPGKNGVTFGLDAATGEFVWVEETVYNNVFGGVDPETGLVLPPKEDALFTEIGQQQTFCPAIPGGRLWQATAYSPDTGLFYLPAANLCQTSAPQAFEMADTGQAMGLFQTFGNSLAPGAEGVGSLHAMNVDDGEHAFDVQQGPRFTSSILTTAGGLLFVGDADRYVYALNDETGETVWKTRLHAPIGGYPMTYEIDGVQYLAIAAGQSGQTHPAQTPGLQVPMQGANAIFVYKLRDAE